MDEEHINSLEELIVETQQLLEIAVTHGEYWKKHADALAEALEPFAHFIEQWNKKPLGFDVDDIYSIHSGTEWEASITISNLQRALAALTNYRSRDE